MPNSSTNRVHHVILRDDDTNALTPAGCLDQLYRPFLDRRLPVTLAVIPEVRTTATRPDGQPEGFLQFNNGTRTATAPLGTNTPLTAFLHAHPGLRIAQHGCYHDSFEFDQPHRNAALQRLEQGARRLEEAGLRPPAAFVAPHDKFSRATLPAVARRFRVVSTGWFELRCLPPQWWPSYLVKKIRRRPHWRAGRTLLLSHPGCILSCHRDLSRMLAAIQTAVASQTLTVLVTHWWEYFQNREPNLPFIRVLHDTARWLADTPNVRVITFDDLLTGNVPLA